MEIYYSVKEKQFGEIILFTNDYTKVEVFFSTEDIDNYEVDEFPDPHGLLSRHFLHSF